jgi:spectrin beta, non-erythrocytic 1/4/5
LLLVYLFIYYYLLYFSFFEFDRFFILLFLSLNDMATPKPKQSTEHWLRLQRKLFSRWVSQKLSGTDVQIEDCVNDLSDGIALVKLIEVLSGAKFSGKLNTKAKFKAHKVDNLSQALAFVWDSNVEMKLRPSPENMYDQEEKPILGMIWAIMMKFMRFDDGDEDGSTSNMTAKDALQMWCNSQLKSHGIEIHNMKTDFANGMALCALVHKHRPKLIDFDSLDPNDSKTNLQTAFDAAEKFFGLEQYLTTDDITQMDEKSMVVYVSEYYYGIAAARKIDAAVRRIHKLIQYTRTNDAMKKECTEQAVQLIASIDDTCTALSDRTIHNTMEDAEREMEEFYAYKKDTKTKLTQQFLFVEKTFNNLSMRLQEGKRPAFTPPAGNSVADLRAKLHKLDEEEVVRKEHLQKELERQRKLKQLAEQHTTMFDEVNTWGGEKKAYLETKDEADISSVGEATFRLNTLSQTRGEMDSMRKTNIMIMSELQAQLAEGKYQHLAAVQEKAASIETLMSSLDELANAKELRLQDAKDREEYKAMVRGWAQQHTDRFEVFGQWVNKNKTYLNTKEDVNSVSAAKLQLALLETYEHDHKDTKSSVLPALERLSTQLREAKYESEYSSWTFDLMGDVETREADAVAALDELDQLSATKKSVLEDDLARETFRAATITKNKQHTEKCKKMNSWLVASTEYLAVKEETDGVDTSQRNLNTLLSHGKELQTQGQHHETLNAGALELVAAEYKTDLSEWRLPDSEQVTERVESLKTLLASCNETLSVKKLVLEDDLARENFKATVMLQKQQHVDRHKKLIVWADESDVYLAEREEVDSSASARGFIARLESYESDTANVIQRQVSNLNELGADLKRQEYKSDLSQWKFDDIQEVDQREADISQRMETLTTAAAQKRAYLDDKLALEELKERVRLWNTEHVDRASKLSLWQAEERKYLESRDEVDSVPQAELNLSRLYDHTAERTDQSNINFAALKQLGERICAAEHKSAFSDWRYEEADAVNSRQAAIGDEFDKLTPLAAERLAIGQDDLERETFRAKLFGWDSQHVQKFAKLNEWCDESEAYLEKKDSVDSVDDAVFNLATLASFEAEKADTTKFSVSAMTQQGQDILTAEYKSERSRYTFEKADEVRQREADIDARFTVLEEKRVTKDAILKDDLEREQVRASTEREVQRHKDRAGNLSSWAGTNFLHEEHTCGSIEEAQKNLWKHSQFEQDREAKLVVVSSVKDLGSKICETEYKSDLSTWRLSDDKMAALHAIETDLDAAFEAAKVLSGQVKTQLEADLEREQKKNDLKIAFANQATGFVRWVRYSEDALKQIQFGLTSAEVEQFPLDDTDTSIRAECQDRVDTIHATEAEMKTFAIESNEYCAISSADVDSNAAKIETAITDRRTRYTATLEEFRAKEAAIAEIVKDIASFEEHLENAKNMPGSAEEQLAALKCQKESKLEDEMLQKIKQKADAVEETWFAQEAATQLEMFNSFIDDKLTTVAEFLEFKKLRGLTAEQMTELKEMFAQFDDDQSGTLDARELRVLFYSVGDERNKAEIEQIIAENGADGKLSEEGFITFMIHAFGDQDTPEEIISGFRLMSRGASQASMDSMELVMTDEDLDYLRNESNACNNDGAFDYEKWVTEVYQR